MIYGVGDPKYQEPTGNPKNRIHLPGEPPWPRFMVSGNPLIRDKPVTSNIRSIASGPLTTQGTPLNKVCVGISNV